jgi:hypothetical protein
VKNLIYQVKKKLPSAAKACVRDTVATVSTICFKACGEVKLSEYLFGHHRSPSFKCNMGGRRCKKLLDELKDRRGYSSFERGSSRSHYVE